MPLQLPDRLELTSGLASLKNLIAEAPQGTYEVKFECKNMSLKVATLTLTVTSGPSISPVSVPSTCTAGGTLPVSVIQLLTHAGRNMKVEEKRVTLEFAKTQYLYLGQRKNKQRGGDSTYHFSNVPCPTKAGTYELKFQCKIVKSTLEHISPLEVTPGEPVKLEVLDPNFEFISCDGSNEGLILKDTKIHLVDAFGNQIDIGGGAVKISIEPVDDVQLEGKSLPKIRGASQMKMINSVATFDKICLAEGVGKSGQYNLCFSLVGHKEFAPKVLDFFYQNELDVLEHKISQRIKSKTAELATLREEMENIENEKRGVENQFTQVQERLFSLIPNLNKNDLRSRKALTSMLSTIEADIEKMQTTSPRAPKSRNTTPIPGLENDPAVIGRVNEIVCIDDEVEARMLSKHCGRRIEGILVQNQKTFDKYLELLKDSKNGVYLMSLESMASYKHASTAGHLDISTAPDAPTEGYLGHASNRVQLRPEHEDLRKTLVWNLFGTVMVFDTLKHGFGYRNYVVKKGASCPHIIALQDENSIESTGMVFVGEKKTTTQAGEPCFGQLPYLENSNYKRLVDTKTNLEEFIECAMKRKHVNSESKNTDELRHRVSEIENEVSSLSSDLKAVNEGLKSLDVAHPSRSSGSASADISMSGSLDSQPPPSPAHPPSPPSHQNGPGKGKSNNKRKFVDQD